MHRRRSRAVDGHASIWALRDVCLEVHQGEVVGVIGRNGAGKSTLLKILSRITEPTEGFADLRGRASSLLEVGSGFHQDLTGAENVFLYGAILGMRRQEIRRKFDEIVEFAEVEDFLDTPVKRYSSGMYMRLAFSVAAHLEPEILIVDEVLAVGDIPFQRKCLGKMEGAARGGRTVLFVSHNMAAVTTLCTRAYLLDKGRIVNSGPAADLVADFLRRVEESMETPLGERDDRGGDGSARLVSIRIEDADHADRICLSSRLRVTLGYTSRSPLRFPQFRVSVYDAGGNGGLFRLDSHHAGGLPDMLPPSGFVTCVTEPIDITAGRCSVNAALFRGGVLVDSVDGAAFFDVEQVDFYGSGALLPPRSSFLALREHRWIVGEHD